MARRKNDQLIEALHDALWQSRVTLVILVLLLVGGVGVVVYSLVMPASLPIDEEAIIAKAKERLQANGEVVIQEVTDFTAEVGPPVLSSIVRQAREDMPAYVRSLKDQSDELVAGLETQLKTRLRKKASEFIAKQRQVFKDEFPEITDEETVDRILEKYRIVANELMERYYLDDFRSEIKRTASTWEKFEPVDPPTNGTLEDQLVEYTGDWVALRLKDAGTSALKFE